MNTIDLANALMDAVRAGSWERINDNIVVRRFRSSAVPELIMVERPPHRHYEVAGEPAEWPSMLMACKAIARLRAGRVPA